MWLLTSMSFEVQNINRIPTEQGKGNTSWPGSQLWVLVFLHPVKSGVRGTYRWQKWVFRRCQRCLEVWWLSERGRLLQSSLWLEVVTVLSRRTVPAKGSSSGRGQAHRHWLLALSAISRGAAQGVGVEGRVSSCKMLMARKKPHNSWLRG